jgi:uncharacterized membrane protein HdeD (DUF308 family)
MIMQVIGWFLIICGIFYAAESIVAKNWGSLAFSLIVGIGLGFYLRDKGRSKKNSRTPEQSS